MSSGRPFDIIVYGASGFTGQYVAAETFRTKEDKTMAIAGRNKAKLEKVLDFIQEETGGENVHSQVSIVLADNTDDESIGEMCRQCRVVINCVGPYTLYGEKIVKTCVETATHHVDISGEPKFLEMCQLKYHDAALAAGIHIVGTCGFDSIPSDYGLELLREKFPGELTYAESYIHPKGEGANTGTFFSIIHGIVDKDEAARQNKLIFKNKLPYVGPKTSTKMFGWAKSESRYFIPFFGPDPAVVRRTQLFESSVHGHTPIRYHAYLTVSSLIELFFLAMLGIVLFVFTRCQLGINLLMKYPYFFTFGTFSPNGVSKEDIAKGNFKIVFHGKGYSKKPENPETAGEPDQSMSMTFAGPEMGYIFTSIAMVASAETLLDDTLVNKGGVLTPGSAFQGTRLEERLLKRGVKITVS